MYKRSHSTTRPTPPGQLVLLLDDQRTSPLVPEGELLSVKEIKTLEWYILDTQPKSVRITEGEAHTLKFYNQRQGTLVIRKLDKLTKEPLAGVEFALTYKVVPGVL